MGRDDEPRDGTGRIEQRLDARSWADQGREDLAALREPKLLGGDGQDASELRMQVEELRQKREELPAAHQGQVAAAEQIEREVQKAVAEVEKRRDQELSVLDKLIEKARELAAEVKERTVAAARNVAERMELFFGAGKQTPVEEATLAKEQEQARSPDLSTEERLAQKVAGLDRKLTAQESIEAKLVNLDKRMDMQAREEQKKERTKQQEIERSLGRSRGRDFGIER